MSLPEVLEAVKHRLATANSWVEDRVVSLTFEEDGRPPLHLTSFQDFHVGVAGIGLSPGEYNETNPGLHEVVDFECVVSKKITYEPKAQLNRVAYERTKSLYAIARLCTLTIHDNWTLVGEINTLLGISSSVWGFITTPKWQGTDARPMVKGPDWLGVEQGTNGYECLVVKVRFGRLERVQCATKTVT